MTWMEVELSAVALTLLGGLEGAVMEESKTEVKRKKVLRS